MIRASASTAPLVAPDLERLATTDGAFSTHRMDLFATHSATGAARQLGYRPASHLTTARAVLGQATPIGMGETVGAPADAWSTTYASGILFDLGYVAPPSWARFLRSLERGGGYSMFPGCDPDTWATGFAALTLSRFDRNLVDKFALARWIGSAQTADGGITWAPADAEQRAGDMRATGFVADALREANGIHLLDGHADVEALVCFVADHQGESGGFALNSYSSPCMWGTGAAIAVLESLEVPVPNAEALVEFVMNLLDAPSGGFRRGPAYDTRADVWATRHAVRVLQLVAPDRLQSLKPRIVEFLTSCELPDGGSTYTEVGSAGDALSTAAAVLAGYGTSDTSRWLSSCVMPGDDGFAYMPGRGTEVRTSQWATAALDMAGIPYNTGALLEWASRAQNLDGGFGRWEGRASEVISTAAVVATLDRAGKLSGLPGIRSLSEWIGASIDRLGRGAPADAAVAANLARAATAVTSATGSFIDPTPCLHVIDELAIDGAFRRQPRLVPDLATTYAVLLAHQATGVRSSLPAARVWVERLAVHPNGVAWSPASSDGGGLLSTALATLVANAADGSPLPDLSL